jgi:flavodoxin
MTTWHAPCVHLLRPEAIAMDPTRTLVVFYSKTGTTEIVARAIRDELGCEIEAIHDLEEREGIAGYLHSGFDAMFHRPAALRAMSSNAQDYELVIVGTPIWDASVSARVRTYLTANRDRIRKVAFFCTHGGSGSARVLREMEEICGRHPVVALVLRTEEVRHDAHGAKVRTFASALDEPVRSRAAAQRAKLHLVQPPA